MDRPFEQRRQQSKAQGLYLFKRHTAVKYVITVLLVLGATLLQKALWPWIGNAPYLLFYPAVILAALYGDGNSAILLSALVAQYYFIEPGHSLSFQGKGDILRVSLFLLSSALIRKITHALTEARIRAEDARLIAEEATGRLEYEKELRDQFVSTLTHDLRNPLSAVIANANLIKRYPEKQESHGRWLDKVLQSAQRTDKMIQDLLDVNQVKAGRRLWLKLDPCDLNGLVDEVLEDFSAQYGDRFRKESFKDSTGVWSCDGLRRAIENLLRNAVKYGNPEKPITVTTVQDGDQVRLMVHNHGDPIPTEEQVKLFEPFSRAKSAKLSGKEGWGLGLPLVRGIAEAHGGTITVESDEAQGTTFAITLPRDARSAQASSVAG